MEEVPKTFDWVTARAECSLAHLFTLLTELMDSDVKNMQTRAPKGTQFTFERLNDVKVVIAKLSGAGGVHQSSNVVITLTPSSIAISSTGSARPTAFLAKPSFHANGRCRLEVDGRPFELWQVSRMALEDLFFQ